MFMICTNKTLCLKGLFHQGRGQLRTLSVRRFFANSTQKNKSFCVLDLKPQNRKSTRTST